MALHRVLAAHRPEILKRWKNLVHGDLAPDAMPTMEIVDHIPVFLDEIAQTLATALPESPGNVVPESSDTAAGHGAQRLRLGFSLDAVVREYGALRDTIVAVAIEQDAAPTFDELQVLFTCIIDGIANAVSEYALQRDAELARQNNEHFAFIAHELRNPLSSATLAFQMLSKKGGLPENDTMVAALSRALTRTSDLIDQTLQISRAFSGITLRRQTTTLHALFDDVLMDAISEAEGKGVELRTVITTDERISVDIRLIRSAIGNLLRNGVKYTQPRTVVQLRGRISEGKATVEIEDCCGGLPPGRSEDAFVPFVQLKNRKDGFGLGLAIAREAMDAHGGSVGVTDLPGKGCIFVLEFPVIVEGA